MKVSFPISLGNDSNYLLFNILFVLLLGLKAVSAERKLLFVIWWIRAFCKRIKLKKPCLPMNKVFLETYQKSLQFVKNTKSKLQKMLEV